MKKTSITESGFRLNYLSRQYDRGIFARQLEPTKGLYGNISDEEQALLTPIYVGLDGESGEDLASVIYELRKYREAEKETRMTEAAQTIRLVNNLRDEVSNLYDEFEKLTNKKWWKFWR